MRGLVWGYRALVFTSLVTLLLAAGYLGIAIYLSIDGGAVTTGAHVSSIVSLISIYFFAVFGTLSNLVMLIRSIFYNHALGASTPGVGGRSSFGNAPKWTAIEGVASHRRRSRRRGTRLLLRW